MRSRHMRMSLTITSTTADASWPFELSCRHVSMAGRIDTPAKCELVIFSSFKQKVYYYQYSCFLQVFTRLRRVILTSGDVLIHDNAHPHSAVVTQQLLNQFKLDVSARLSDE
ncbi:hypothetical protein AVEN_195847-1 [Araneus ventricosus]|uniref:Histone-lysine N-methyltransferase SETMAR n=1 Tax=Araneus ventricosus TaxID=182803 RepID=A0A4Y2Q9T3_ARAVE|nr:hypothetical protein AVEN_195847-1 [Araneus ventricosus]